ncbi:MAG TPA: endonuclease/exonuclease/phosphatase family protein [Marmoricola sp.]|nr:endonuclease/exonuclease/phosphatase family protein [Marmoricola sp.]
MFLTLCRVLTPSSRLWVLATAFVPYAALGYSFVLLVVALAFRWSRRRWLLVIAGLAGVGLVFHLALLAPLYAGPHRHGRADLTVMTANLRLGEADPRSVVRLVRDQHVDLLVLEEVTPAVAGALVADGILAALPHAAGSPAPGAGGTVVVSRYPLTSQAVLATGHGGYRMQVQAPRPFWLVAVHPSQPLTDVSAWSRDWSAIDGALAALHGPRLLVGDLNSTLDHGPVRTALDGGLHDAATEADSGWQPTWPSGVKPYRLPFGVGLFAIDHVLASAPFAAVATETFDVAGTDHRALVARLRIS